MRDMHVFVFAFQIWCYNDSSVIYLVGCQGLMFIIPFPIHSH